MAVLINGFSRLVASCTNLFSCLSVPILFSQSEEGQPKLCAEMGGVCGRMRRKKNMPDLTAGHIPSLN